MKTKEIKQYIASDLYRYTGKLSVKLFVKSYILNLGFRYTFWLRLCKADAVFLRVVARFMHWRLSRRLLIQIPHNTRIGYGLYLGHHMCVIINPSAVLGDNINISQFVTIGANRGKAAEIGSNVYIGPNSCIVENIKIGDNVTIGAGSVVIKDVEPNATVAGVPAKYINSTEPARYVNRRWSF